MIQLFIFLLLITITNGQRIDLILQNSYIPTDVVVAYSQCYTACPTYGSNQYFPILSYTGWGINYFSPHYFPSNTPLYYGDVKIGKWENLVGVGNLDVTLWDAGVRVNFVTGSLASGAVGDHCGNGTPDQGYNPAAAGYATRGDVFALTNPLIGGTPLPCNYIQLLYWGWFCGCYSTTSAPTGIPTKKPTNNPSKKPTKKPTKNPTITPTTNPTIYGVQLRRVKLGKGTQITLSSAIVYKNGRPVKTTLPPTTSLQEVRWLNVQWSILGVAQTMIASCNPIPTPLPGVVVNGRCPCVDLCTSAPGVGIPMKFTSLRCCITSYTESIIGTVSATSSMIVIDANISNSESTLPQSFGALRCNSAIERTLNCQFQRQSVLYIPQCTTERITCFQNETIGYGFGLFWNQNPLYPYYIPVSEWGVGQYQGIASILNNLVYSRQGKLVDPLNWKRMTEYYWLVNFTAVNSSFPAYQLLTIPDVLQAEPTDWLLDLPFVSSLPYQTCLNNLAIGLTTGCDLLTWDTVAESYFKLPGTWLVLNLTDEVVQYFLLTSSVEWSGVELYLNDVLIYQNLTPSLIYTLPSQRTGLLYSIRLLGKESVWDIPSLQLSSSLPFYPDSLWSAVQMYSYQFPFYPLVTTQGSVYGTINGKEGDFPYKNTSVPFDLELEMVYAFTSTIWSNLTQQILENNIYPENEPLRLVESEYDTRPIDLNSETDKGYLLKIFQARLAPRQASENFQCKTFDLGDLDFYQFSPVVTQKWYAASDDSYNIPSGSREGGCTCSAFYSRGLFCGGCLTGLGGDGCQYPYQLDPVAGGTEGVCSLHGTSIPSSLTVEFNLTLFDNIFPLCQSLLYQGDEYTLFTNAAQGVGYLYINVLNQIFITPGAVYINLELTPSTITQLEPTIWATDLGRIECTGGFWQNDYYLVNNTVIESVNPLMGKLFPVELLN